AGFVGVPPPVWLMVPSVVEAGQLSTSSWKRWPPANVATGVVPFVSAVAARFPIPALWLDSDAVGRFQLDPLELVSVYTRPVEKHPLLPVAPSNRRRSPVPSFTSWGSGSRL